MKKYPKSALYLMKKVSMKQKKEKYFNKLSENSTTKRINNNVLKFLNIR